jgi:glutamyl-tRNA synthetase
LHPQKFFHHRERNPSQNPSNLLNKDTEDEEFNMTPILRFAPSPTGRLHVGNIRIALMNWLYTRKNHGKFILRMDDTDAERSTQEFAYSIIEDLGWLGLKHDEIYHQSDRFHKYETEVDKLKASGRLYPCYETPDELAFKRKQQLARGRPPIYDRAALKLTDSERAKLEQNGLKPHWRLKLETQRISWIDLVHGKVEFESDKLSDPVLLREDGMPLYTLSSVVDDIDLGVTHIFRGDDHIANTAVQIQLINALGGDASKFTFCHMPLLTDASGGGLSKRTGSLSIENLKDDGIEPMAILCLLSSLGTSEQLKLTFDVQDLIDRFETAHINRSSVKFSFDELAQVNQKLLHHMPFVMAQPRLKKLNLNIDEATWDHLKGNIKKFDDIKHQWMICHGDITPIIDEPDFIKEALALLPAEPWDEDTWSAWTTSIKEKTGRSGKQLFMPLRECLTGESHGPEMKHLLPLMGYKKTKARLEGKQG